MEPRMKLTLRVGSRVTGEYPLDAEVIRLGRERARTIPINDTQVSRQHAEITCDIPVPSGGAVPELVGEGERDGRERGWVITDLGSTNGTFVNGQRLAGSHRLRVGDQIRVGNTAFTFEEVESGRRFRTVVAILIALSTLVGALVAWRGSVAFDNAAGARGSGTNVLIKGAQVRTEVASWLSQFMDSFTAYQWQALMANLIAADQPQFEDTEVADSLETERLRYANLALAAFGFLNLDYVRRADKPEETIFEKDRFVETNIAEAASREDLDYQAHYREADREAQIARRLTLAAIPLSLSIFFYTAATIARRRLKYVWVTAGGLLFILGGLAAALIEINSRQV
jgi:pSer/pThr/pTyr-binding forkhead associated (FHA) protein